jgi:hypothetical protein
MSLTRPTTMHGVEGCCSLTSSRYRPRLFRACRRCIRQSAVAPRSRRHSNLSWQTLATLGKTGSCMSRRRPIASNKETKIQSLRGDGQSRPLSLMAKCVDADFREVLDSRQPCHCTSNVTSLKPRHYLATGLAEQVLICSGEEE